MPKYLLTNEVIATKLWRMLITNPAYSEDLTTKAKPGKGAVGTDWLFIPGVLNAVKGWWDPAVADEFITTTTFTPQAWRRLLFFTEPPPKGWAKLRYAVEPPPKGWNKLLYDYEL